MESELERGAARTWFKRTASNGASITCIIRQIMNYGSHQRPQQRQPLSRTSRSTSNRQDACNPAKTLSCDKLRRDHKTVYDDYKQSWQCGSSIDHQQIHSSHWKIGLAFFPKKKVAVDPKNIARSIGIHTNTYVLR